MPPPRQVASIALQLVAHRLPPRIALFYLRALAVAIRRRNGRSLYASTRPREVAHLLRVARDRRVVVEIGTGFAWTSAALALAHPDRLVISIDPLVRPHRERYLSLLDGATRARLELVEAQGQDGPSALRRADMPPVYLLYIDGGHARESTVASFEAWRPALAARAVVAFHDYGEPQWPGVSEAVAQLGLEGEVEGTLFVSRL